METSLDEVSWHLNSNLLWFSYPMMLPQGILMINSVQLMNGRANHDKKKIKMYPEGNGPKWFRKIMRSFAIGLKRTESFTVTVVDFLRDNFNVSITEEESDRDLLKRHFDIPGHPALLVSKRVRQ